MLASINTQLQKKNQDMYTVYQKIFKCAFLEPILHNTGHGNHMRDDNVRTDIDEIDYQCSNFELLKEQCVPYGLLSPSELHSVLHLPSGIHLRLVFWKWILLFRI